MSKIYDVNKAFTEACYRTRGTFCTKKGSVYKGIIDDVQNSANDPDGIGYVLVLSDPPHGDSCIYANEFAWAEFDD